MQAVERAKTAGLIDFHLGPQRSTFNVDEYEFFEQVCGALFRMTGPARQHSKHMGNMGIVGNTGQTRRAVPVVSSTHERVPVA